MDDALRRGREFPCAQPFEPAADPTARRMRPVAHEARGREGEQPVPDSRAAGEEEPAAFGVAEQVLVEEQPDDAGAEQNSGSKTAFRVSKSAVEIIAQKVGEILTAQGFSCFSCPKVQYKLYPLSGDCLGVVDGDILQYRKFHMDVFCGGTLAYAFELSTTTVNDVKICEGGLIDG